MAASLRVLLGGLLAAGLSASAIFAQQPISVEQLKRDFASRPKNQEVSVQGRFSPEKRVWALTITGYYLKDRDGSLIQVRTRKPLPNVASQILVTGVVDQDAQSGEIYITETKREVLAKQPEAMAKKPEVAAKKIPRGRKKAPRPESEGPSAAQQAQQEPATRPGQESPSLAIAIAIGGAAFLLVVVAIKAIRRKRPRIKAPAPRRPQPRVKASPPPTPSFREATPPSEVSQELPGLRVYKTTKVLPGRLIVLRNQEETDIIYLTDQSGLGEIDIGRDSPDATTGIRIKDPTHTLSRRQARVIYSALTGEFELLNLAGPASNPTTVNGRQLSPNETVVLKDEDILGMGSLQFKFKQKQA